MPEIAFLPVCDPSTVHLALKRAFGCVFGCLSIGFGIRVKAAGLGLEVKGQRVQGLGGAKNAISVPEIAFLIVGGLKMPLLLGCEVQS